MWFIKIDQKLNNLLFEVHKLVRLLDLESPKPLVGKVDNPSR